MNTTNLFVELLVIGLGPVVAIGLLLLVAIGPEAASMSGAVSTASSIAIAVPVLGLMYVLGIIADRIADRIFGFWSRGLRGRRFASDAAYHDARRTIVMHSEMLHSIRQYGRSRMRITRGWAFNCLLLVVPINLWTGGAFGMGPRVTWVLNGALLALFVGSVFAWYSLATSEYHKIQGGADFVRRELGNGHDAAPEGRRDAPEPSEAGQREPDRTHEG